MAVQFINYENTKSKQIVSLSIRVESENYKKSVWIDFTGIDLSSVDIHIECEEKDLHNIKQGLIDIIHEMQPRHNWISYNKFENTIWTICSILFWFGSIQIYKLIGKYIGWNIIEDTDLEIGILKKFVIVIVATGIQKFVIVITYLLFIPSFTLFFSYFTFKIAKKYIYRFLFPGSAYIIGKGKSRDKFRKQVLNLLIGALITLCIGIILLLLEQLIW